MQQNQQQGQQQKPQQHSGNATNGSVSTTGSLLTQAQDKKSLSWEPAKETPRAAAPAAAAEPSAPKRASAVIAAVVILVALGVWGVSALREHKGATITKTVANKEASAIPNSVEGSNQGTLSVAPQAAGDTVHVSGISVTEPTWIVVYDDIDGKAGNTLGAELAFPGQDSVEVNLLRSTKAGATYLVGESASDNGSHTYSRSLTQLDNWNSFTAQ